MLSTNIMYIYGDSREHPLIFKGINDVFNLDYPATIKVSSNGGAADLHSNFMGIYETEKNLFNFGKPVWRHTKEPVFLFYYG